MTVYRKAPSIDSGEADEAYAKRLEDMRRIVEKLQAIQSSLDAVAEGRSTFARQSPYVLAVVHQVDDDLVALHPARGAEMEAVGTAKNLWARAKASPVFSAPNASPPGETWTPEIREVLDLLAQMVLGFGRVTIPPRVNDWLNGTVPSYYLPFHDIFSDELPRPEDRQSILKDLALNPASIPRGLVSPAQGLIYRHSGNRVRSWAIVGLLAALGVGIGWVLLYGRLPLAAWITLGRWTGDIAVIFSVAPAGNPASYLLPWAAILAGILVHVLVDVQKRAADEGRPPLFSLTLFPLWVDALAGGIVFKVLLSLVALGGMWAFPIGPVTPATAFLVGYSLDSFVGIFGDGLGRRAGAQAAAWKEKIEKS